MAVLAKRLFPLCVAVGFILAACVKVDSATLTEEGSDRELRLRSTTTGLLAGPCSPPFPGRSVEQHWIRLKGPGPVYTVREIEFLDRSGVAVSVPSGLEGSIRIDSEHHRAVVDLRGRVGPSVLNGPWRLKESE